MMIMQRSGYSCRSCVPLVLALALVLVAGAAMAGKVQIPADTEVKVKFDERAAVNSKDAVSGVPILIELAEPLKIGGVTIVEEGAKGTAVISEVEKAGRGGKPGKIAVEFVDLEPMGEFKSPEDQRIKLTGTASNKGKGKKTLSYILGFGLFIKGGQGELPTDSAYTAKVSESIILESE